MISSDHIIIVRTDRLGDVLLTLPMARWLKENTKTKKITFICNTYTAPVVALSPFVDAVVPAENADSVFAENPNESTVIFVTPHRKFSMKAFAAGVKFRVGTSRRWFSLLYTNRIALHRKPSTRHEVEYNFELLRPFGFEGLPKRTLLDGVLHETEEIIESKNRKLKNLFPGGIPEDYVIIHPGSGGSSADLPIESYIKLSQLILEKSRSHIFITGSAGEAYLGEQFPSNNRISNMCGVFLLPELFSLFAGARLFLSNSTGTLHLAVAAGVPVAGFFPKAVTCSPVRWGPFTDRSLVFTPETDCHNCTIEECRLKKCMETIQTANVLQALEIYLK